MVTLTTESTKGQKTYYAEALLRVGGVSQYNDDQIRFDGLEGYWKMTEWAFKATNGKIPPVGAVAWFKLATNPKKGTNAKPGSMYQDIMGIRKATDEEIASVDTQAHANGSGADYPHRDAEPVAQGPQGAQNTVQPLEQRILLGMAYNNLSTILAGGAFNNAETAKGLGVAQEMWDQWWIWYGEASAGRPLSPVQPPQPEAEPEPELSPRPAIDMGDGSVITAMTADEIEQVERYEKAQQRNRAVAEAKAQKPAEDVQELPW